MQLIGFLFRITHLFSRRLKKSLISSLKALLLVVLLQLPTVFSMIFNVWFFPDLPQTYILILLLRLVFFRVSSDSEAALFESQLPSIQSLVKGCKSAKVVRSLEEVPEGCGSLVVSPNVIVHVLVRVSTAFKIGI